MLSEPPLAGREEELGALDGALQRVLAGSGGLFLISGEAGIGKTRLAKEFEAKAADRGCKVLVGNCVPSAQIPYLVFLEALEGLSDEGIHSRASRLKGAARRAAPDLVGAIPVVGGTAHALAKLLKEYQGDEGEGRRENLLFGTLELLKTESVKTPLIIHLDDLQWADSASIGMLHFLARNVRDLPILLLGTYRTEEVLIHEKEVHPFLDSLQVMRREGVVEEVNLRPLAEKEIQKVVSGMLQEPVDRAIIERIFKESGGSPLFAIETLRMLMSEGGLVIRDGTWRMARDGKMSIPRTVQEIIWRRMAKLSNEQKRILECASVIGERFDAPLLSESIGIEELHLLDELDALSKGFQLVAWDEGYYKFTHAKIRDVTYDAISKPKQAELHRRVGCSLEKRLPDDALLGALSWHFDRAHAKDKCIKYSLLAGKYCSARKALREAKSFYQLVIARTEDDSGFLAERLESLEGLGDLGPSQSSPKGQYSYYERFLGLNRDRKARGRVLVKAGACWGQYGLANPKKANEMFNEAESLSDGDPGILAYIEWERGDLSHNEGDRVEAQSHYNRAKAYFEETGDTKEIIRFSIGEMYQLTEEDRSIEAKALAEELLPMVRKTEDPDLIANFGSNITHIYAIAGETELAKKYAADVIQQTEKLGLVWEWMRALTFRSWALELEGDFESARKDIMKVLDCEKMLDTNPFFIGFSEVLLGIYEWEMGLVKSAENHYVEAMKLLVTHDKRGHTWAAVLLAELLAAKDDFQQSDEVYNHTIQLREEKCWLYPLVDCRSWYGMSLARRGMQEMARAQFGEAMKAAKRIGCEKRVQLLAKRVGLTF